MNQKFPSIHHYFPAILSLALLFSTFLAPTAQADSRTSRVLRKNESLSIRSVQCDLKLKSSTAARVSVQCSRKIGTRKNSRPRRARYLTPGQRAQIRSSGCNIQVRRQTKKRIDLACIVPVEPAATPTATPTPTASTVPTETATSLPTATSTATPDPLFSVGGNLSGLSGTVTLQNNGTDNLLLNSNGGFMFSTPLTEGSSYNVTVLTQPANQTCVVTNGAGTIGASNIINVAVSCATNTTTLSLSVSSLALSVTGLTEYGVSGTPTSGLARIITLTNTGSFQAENLDIDFPTFPSGTTSGTTCGSTLAAAASCTVTITPGNTATSDGTNPCSGGTVPVAGAIDFNADNATTVSADVVVLGYGCIYQGGYVYAFDDTTANTESVGGSVMTTSDQAAPSPNGIVWSSNGGPGGGSTSNAADTSLDLIPGIDDISTASVGSPTYASFSSLFSSQYTNPNPFSSSSFSLCNGASDGSCNTSNILIFYNQFITNNTSANGGTPPFTASTGPTNSTYYAAGLCAQTISGYSDWYLPAICEMGYGGGQCGSSSTPATQNAQSNLVDNSLNLLSGVYWSSTESGGLPTSYAWYQIFDTSNGIQGDDSKFLLFGVRCSRKLF